MAEGNLCGSRLLNINGMTALLYLPQQPPQAVVTEGLRRVDSILEQVSLILDRAKPARSRYITN
jgi:hypothetical protein